jgi:phosphoesterase RecJ-like protein
MLVERERGVKVSLRSKRIDISALALSFGGGGHTVAGGFEREGDTVERVSQRLIDEIKKKGLLS